ncbi:phosphoesterase PA-phosphatase related [Parvibaculum lavamentivorans DS-1]|uniref:Phosphoesterase PA-phosphatase related n=1 Tax=Parvibaculum lavamentivorans (strain DS-1 / DSM 13023 / NCIMB 13966) TaxID=402881 RepID=A7HWV7_PARL1|nr:phosphatase PAP2 family protein [Parvibaculum lavamentivorans]ABS64390.1 phosphoesterase PA-phosphatase related [Parvibaculum lavamentivorans DS-1]
MEKFLHDLSWVIPLRSDAATVVFNGFTWLGYAPFFLIFLPIGYWLWNRALFTRLAVLIAVTAVLNGWLKDFWQDARPDPAFQLDAERVSDSYGLPSGHAQVAIAMWFWLAYEIRRPWAWAVAVFLAAGVCFSRLYLGVHDVEDVLVGIGLGLASIAVFAVLVHENIVARWRLLPAWMDFAVIIAAIPLLWVIWPNEREPDQIAAILFLLLGWFAGAAMDRKASPQDPVLPAWWLQIFMAVGGIACGIVVREVLGRTGVAIGLPDAITAYTVFACLGLYATYVAPTIFRALKLMK